MQISNLFLTNKIFYFLFFENNASIMNIFIAFFTDNMFIKGFLVLFCFLIHLKFFSFFTF